MAWSVTAEVSKFSEAVDWFRSKTPVTQAQLDELEDVARTRAFTLSGAMEIEAVQTVFDELAKSLEAGTPFEDFQKAVSEKLDPQAGAPANYLKTVYVNNCQQAYNSGRWVQMNDPAVNALRPFRLFDAVLDDHTCFGAGTPVAMADGARKPIEAIRPGDMILSCRGRARAVVATMVTPKRAWGVLRTACGKTLRVTPNHPILTARGWIPAKMLVPGDALVIETESLPNLWSDVPVDSQRGGLLLAEVLAIWPFPSEAIAEAQTTAVSSVHWELTDDFEPAYDLQVEEDRGFIANGIVVHNSDVCRACDGVVRAWDDPFWESHTPQLHHFCRSQLRSLRPNEAARRGLTEQLPGSQPSNGFGLPPDKRNDGVLRPKSERFDPEVWKVFESREFQAHLDLELEKERVREERKKRDADNQNS